MLHIFGQLKEFGITCGICKSKCCIFHPCFIIPTFSYDHNCCSLSAELPPLLYSLVLQVYLQQKAKHMRNQQFLCKVRNNLVSWKRISLKNIKCKISFKVVSIFKTHFTLISLCSWFQLFSKSCSMTLWDQKLTSVALCLCSNYHMPRT